MVWSLFSVELLQFLVIRGTFSAREVQNLALNVRKYNGSSQDRLDMEV